MLEIHKFTKDILWYIYLQQNGNIFTEPGGRFPLYV